METNKAGSSATATSSPASSSANKGSHVRLIILLGVLVVVLGALAYDHFVAKPAVLEAYNKIHQLVDTTNAQSAAASTRLTSEVIQKEIGKAPMKQIVKDDYTIEYFCWWGPVPFLNTYRQYITVVYVGDEPRRFNSHHMNEYPPEELLDPTYWSVMDGEAGEQPAGDDSGAESPMAGGPDDQAGEQPGEQPGEGGGGKKRGKKKKAPEDAPPGDAPTSDEPATSEPATDQPATDQPATDQPATTDEPAPATEPASDAAGEQDKPADNAEPQEKGEASP